MQTGILRKIDVLIEMTESTTNVDTSKAEKREIELEIEELKEELSFYRESREGEKYFKVSEKQLEENIKVSLEAKIRKQEKAIKKLQKEIDGVVSEESSLHEQIAKLNQEITSSADYINTLNNRLKTVAEPSTKEYYEQLLREENEKIETLSKSLEEVESKDKETLERLNYLTLAMEEMNTKLEDEKTRLTETKASLSSPTSYIDEELKEQDEKRITELQKKITDLEKRKLEIIVDPAMIASEAKELIINGEYSNALSKLQELVTIVKSKPYMDIPSSNELTAMLQEEEEAATTARDEFASLIDTKNYSSGDTEVIEERINFLNSEIASLEDKIKTKKEEIQYIDNVSFKNLTEHLTNTINVYSQLQEELAEYKIIIETENEDKTPKRRAILSAAFERKQKELEDVNSIIEHYKEDQKVLINKAYILESQDIALCEKEIEGHKKEIREMELLLENVSKAKDVLAIENDKQKLKDLDTAVKNIKHRQKYAQTPSEIYDEIEIQLGTMDVSHPTSEFTANINTFEETPIIENNDNEFELESILGELPAIEELDENSVTDDKNESVENNDFVIGDYDTTSVDVETTNSEEA